MTWRTASNVNAKLAILVSHASSTMTHVHQIRAKIKLHVTLESEILQSALARQDGLVKNAKSEAPAVSQ
jgi:hypothetical protein